MPGRSPSSRTGKPCADHTGRAFKSESEMCRHWGISPSAYRGRLARGFSLADALSAPIQKGPSKPCRDHKGIEYPSLTAMFNAYGVNYTVYHYRHDVMGWSQEKALETPLGNTDLAGAHPCTDHLGNEFPSKKAMCDFWHVPRNVYFLRKRAGLPLEDCLAPVSRPQKMQANPVKDHLGNEFDGLDAMCAHWHITKAQYVQNVRNGLGLERALTEKTPRPERPRDHTGKEYPSINAMCRAWGITKTTLRARLELGWTLEQILTHPENNSHLIPCKDHTGQEFPCQKAMLDHWGVTHTTYKHRLRHGRTLAEALSPSSLHAKPCLDHEGREFPCLQAMLDFWLCKTATYHHRRDDLGWGLEQSLAGGAKERLFQHGPRVLKDIRDGWVLASDGTYDYVLDEPGLFRMARRLALDAEAGSGQLPRGMRAKHVASGWFQVWNTPGTGSAPGMLLKTDDAWLERCLVKYGGRPGRKAGEN